MKTRYAFAAVATLLAAGAASAQYVPATYQAPYCREYTKTVGVGGQAQSAYGQACRQPDGSWQISPDDSARSQPVGYMPPPVVQPAAYYPPQTNYYPQQPSYYRAQPSISFNLSSWNRGGGHYAPTNHGWRGPSGHGGGNWNNGGNWNRGPGGHGGGNGRH